MASWLIHVYNLAWLLARPVLRRHHRLRDGFAWRLVPEDWAGTPETKTGLPPRADIWIQAASGGEAYLAWAIAERLPALYRQQGQPSKNDGNASPHAAPNVKETADQSPNAPLRLLVTTWTRQGLEILQGMRSKLESTHPGLSIHVTFFPLDSVPLMTRALRQARPRVVALLETELWPGLMLACSRQNIPLLVLNGRMNEKSLLQYRKLDRFSPNFWKDTAPQHIAATSREYANRFAELFDKNRVEVVPNIKFDNASVNEVRQADNGSMPPAAPELAALLPRQEHSGRTVLLASVREEEEEKILAVIRHLRSGKERTPTIILAPRHMHRVNPWLEQLHREGLTPLTRAERKDAFPAGSLIVWNRFGELRDLYELSDAVFVGGSLAPLGGQNFLEALAAGKIPCCGPWLDNFDWALQDAAESGEKNDSLESRGLLRRCPDANAVAVALKQFLAAPRDPVTVQKEFHAWLSPRQGGASRCAGLLLTCLE